MRFQYIFFLLVFIFTITACNNENADESISPTESITTVSLAIGPSVEQSETPLNTRTNKQEKGLYAINIQWKGKSLNSFQPYASGLFDDISQITIKLIDGYLYRFDCTFLAEYELPYYTMTDDYALKYGQPFSLTSNKNLYAPVTNKLLVSIPPYDEKSPFYQGIYWGDTETEEGRVFSRPSLHRYYGSSELNLINPATEYIQVNIELLRAYYHLQFESDNIPEGDLIRISVPGTATPFTLIGNKNAVIQSDERLLTLGQVANTWNGAILTEETVQIKAEYYSKQAEEWSPIFANSPNIKLKRNKRNTVKLTNVSQPNGESHIQIGEGEVGGAPTDSEEQEIDCKQ